jgi:FtsH-binding integral membrane protein
MHEWRRFLMLPPQNKDGEIASSNNHDHTFYPMIYNLCGITLVLLLVNVIAITSHVENYTPINLVQNNVPYILFVVCISTLSMRMVKFEVVQGLVSSVVELD